MVESTNAGRRVRALAAACVSLVLLLAVGTGSALAAHLHTESNAFGFDGTAATAGEAFGVEALEINQSNRHLFLFDRYGSAIRGYAIADSEHRTPLGAPFPLPASSGYSPDVAVNSDSSQLYFGTAEPQRIYGVRESDGQPISSHFPIEGGFPCAVATDGNGNVFVSHYEPAEIVEYSPDGVKLNSFDFTAAKFVSHNHGPFCTIDIDRSTNDLYFSGEGGGVFRATGASGYTSVSRVYPRSTSAIGVDASTHIVYLGNSQEGAVAAIRPDGAPVEEFGESQGEVVGLTVDEADETVYVARGTGTIQAWKSGAIVPDVTTGPLVSADAESATVSATVDPAGGPDASTCLFEYGENTEYESGTVECEPAPPYSSTATVTAKLPGLKRGVIYHYRIVAGNSNGSSRGADRTTRVAGPPTIDGLFSANIAAESADLRARINPQGADTKYFFEYGTTSGYGSKIPVPAADIGSSEEDQVVTQHLDGLQPRTYHFRLVAENELGKAVSPDQTFNFFPADCPNAHIRQQTGGSYLPDCRAYELVSPEDANGVIMFLESAPDAPYATNPARFAFGAALGAIPGTEPTNAVGVDTYVATRTNTGWKSSYVGVLGKETLGASGLIGDLSFDKALDFRLKEDFAGVEQPWHTTPFIWDYEGHSLGRWPAAAGAIPGAEESFGAWQPSPDFSHLAFSSNNVAFAPNGLTEAPGSAYDYDAAAKTTTLISRLPSGNIPQPTPNAGPTSFIVFPGNSVTELGSPFDNRRPTSGEPTQDYPSVSTDGSHILMATVAGPYQVGESRTNEHLILYMRVNDAVSYEVSKGKSVHYDGMSRDGSKVFFTTNQQMLPADTDSSKDIYMWSEGTDSLTLISTGTGGSGNASVCNSEWIAGCGVEVASGTNKTDNGIAVDGGAVYFYSPEQLDGSEGQEGKRNLYVYRGGSVSYVTTFGAPEEGASRIQVSADGSHMALLTASQLTGFENLGFEEMYSYNPESGEITCVSCAPDGSQPTGDVEASRDGLFMSNDGRTFFYSPDALVSTDTNKLHDVYEYTEGHPQLITTGIGSADESGSQFHARPGAFSGVSADGVNVYFATYDTLVPQDRNGQFLKFYDARVNGGIPFTVPDPPCEAADECHGEGSVKPGLGQVVSENTLGAGGNADEGAAVKHKKAKHKKHHAKKKSKRHHRRGGSR